MLRTYYELFPRIKASVTDSKSAKCLINSHSWGYLRLSTVPWGGRGRMFESCHSDHAQSPEMLDKSGVSGLLLFALEDNYYVKIAFTNLLRTFSRNKITPVP